MASDPTLICLTPIKNEAWILERFLACASTWADHVIVADQFSDDGSRAIAQRFDTVTLIDNDTPAYDEQARQKLLIDAARAIPVDGPRILVALDADEILTANWMTDPEWDRLRTAPPGTVLRFRWLNVAPGVQRGWVDDDLKPFGFVDDGSPHVGSRIHSPRVPLPDGAPEMTFEAVKVLHYQYANWSRMKSKQRWYQCYERVQHPEKRPVAIYRQYHHMDTAIAEAEPIDPAYLDGYAARGIDMTTIPDQDVYYWDAALLDFFETHGVEAFRKLDVWDRDWSALGRALGRSTNGAFDDPRSAADKAVHAWLGRTQPRQHALPVRAVQKLLQVAGW